MRCQAFNIPDHDICISNAGNYIFFPSYKQPGPVWSVLVCCPLYYRSSFSYTITAVLFFFRVLLIMYVPRQVTNSHLVHLYVTAQSMFNLTSKT
jgi:hypothetical protein